MLLVNRHLPLKIVKHIFRHLIFTSFLIVIITNLYGCSAQSQVLTNVAQAKPTDLSPTPTPANSKVLSTQRDTFPFEIKGVGIGASYQIVLRQLGKPLSSRKGGTNPCGGTKQVMRYSGLTITLDESEDEQSDVILIEVTSPKWEVASRISVGKSLEEVRAKFGQPDDATAKSDLEILAYFDGDGAVNFYFRKKKLVKITRDLNLC